MLIIGERINTSRKPVNQAVANRDAAYIEGHGCPAGSGSVVSSLHGRLSRRKVGDIMHGVCP